METFVTSAIFIHNSQYCLSRKVFQDICILKLGCSINLASDSLTRTMEWIGKNKWLFKLFLLLAGFHMIGANVIFANVGEAKQLKCPENRVNSWQYGTDEFLVVCENGKTMINMNLSKSDRIKESGDCTFLTITNFTKEDTGTYSCYYQDSKDKKVYKQHAVHVKLRNSPVVQNKTVTFSASKTPRTLECNASGVPDVYNFSTWQHYTYNNELVRRLHGNTNGTLFLHENVSTYEDSGIYECNVTNGVPDEWGHLWHTGAITVTIEGKPEKPNGVVISSSSKYIFLQWKSGLNGGYRQSFIIQYRKNSSSAWKYLKKENAKKTKQSLYILNLEPSTKYEVRLYACNKFGKSTMTKHCISTTGEKSNENQSYWTEFLLILVVIILVCIGIAWWRLKKAKNSLPDNSHRADDERIQVEGDAIENNLYQAANHLIEQPSGSSNREDDAYSCIGRRKQIVHKQNVTYQISKKDQKENKDQHQSSMNNGLDPLNLDYVEVVFDNTTNNGAFCIHGADARTPYADIDFSARADPLIISEENEESLSLHSVENDDFVSLEEVQQWVISKE